MKLIVGLGNPGKEYINTRHNIGFMLIDYLVDKLSIDSCKNKFNAVIYDYNYNGERILLVKPQSYMNLSGGVVKKIVDFYKIDLNDILIIHDDLDMDFSRIKFVYDSSSGGHNGIKDIEKNLSSKKYCRLKIGISNNKSVDTKDYVLGSFNNEELNVIKKRFNDMDDLIVDFCNMDYNMLMNKYNKK